MQKFLLFSALLFSLQLHAQKAEGVWEGTLFLNGSAKTPLKIRMEIVEQDSSCFGILYSRGLEKNTIFGCDYFVTGFRNNNNISLKWQKVQRSIGMSNNDCRMFEQLRLNYRKKDTAQMLEGKWFWAEGRKEPISFIKVSDRISDMADDEISAYVKDLYEVYETSGLMLAVQDRFPKKVIDLPVDNNDVIVEFSTIDSSMHDSVSVYVNGKSIADHCNLMQKALRIRLKELPFGSNDLQVVNESVLQSKLNILMKIIYKGQINQFSIQPGFTVNSLILLTRKEE